MFGISMAGAADRHGHLHLITRPATERLEALWRIT